MISLPDWCARHTFKEFLELMEDFEDGSRKGLNATNSSEFIGKSHGQEKPNNSSRTEANGERHSLRS